MADSASNQMNRRRFLQTTSLAALAVTLNARTTRGESVTTGPADPPVEISAPPLIAPVRPQLLPDPPLDVKIGQMLMIGFKQASVTPESVVAKNIRDQNVGQVVLFGNNIQSKSQLEELTHYLKSLSTYPLLLCTDQEGGLVARLTPAKGFPATLTPADLGRKDDLAATRAAAAEIAENLAAAGIGLNLAPVVDLAVNPRNPIVAQLKRSFSADPEIVAAQAGAFIDGHHDKGVKCTLKHFPGHGSSTGDTHAGFVDVTNTWSEQELVPYRKLIEAGKVDAIMTAHIFNAKLDEDLPATLSPKVITGLLREQLGYDGVVISDDMQMRAISDLYRLDRAVELAILAGVDIIAVAGVIAYSGTVADQFFTTVNRMLEDGKITPERIDQSYRRIMKLKNVAL